MHTLANPIWVSLALHGMTQPLPLLALQVLDTARYMMTGTEAESRQAKEHKYLASPSIDGPAAMPGAEADDVLQLPIAQWRTSGYEGVIDDESPQCMAMLA